MRRQPEDQLPLLDTNGQPQRLLVPGPELSRGHIERLLTDPRAASQKCPRCRYEGRVERITHGYHGYAIHSCTCRSCVADYFDKTGLAQKLPVKFARLLASRVDRKKTKRGPCPCPQCEVTRAAYRGEINPADAARVLERAATAASVSNRTRLNISGAGFNVYLLLGEDGSVQYVGRSTNILSRLGDHYRDGSKREVVRSIEVVRCPSNETMCELELALIKMHQPPLNIIGK